MQFCGRKNVPSVRSFRYILQGPKGHSLGQGVVDKLTKLSKIDFSVECFTAYFFSIFYRKASKFDIWRGEWELAIKSKYSRIFLEIFYFFFLVWAQKPAQRRTCSSSIVVLLLFRQLVLSLSDDNNLVPFHLWWTEIVLKIEKVYKCFAQS